ncbi:MAG: heat-inducible transcriptional repressor HrcA [Clostridiaceae bacterium]
MDERKIKILQAIIDDYINTAEPVGSRTIAKKYDLGVSSATIRNEMSDLEDMGYLVQLHTSSGRIPSDKGYRLYVDKLMRVAALSPKEELLIKKSLETESVYEIEKTIKQSMTLLSELTRLTCIVKGPSVRKSFLKSIQLIKIDKFNLLLVILTDSGVIKNNVIRVFKVVDSAVIEKINNILNVFIQGVTVENINHKFVDDLKNGLFGHEDIFDLLLAEVMECLNEASAPEFYIEGAANILNYPEYKDIDKARGFMSFLDDINKVNSLLSLNQGVAVKIGNENFIDEAKNCSIITAVYGLSNRTLGTIGIIGPTRMDYSKVVSILTKYINEFNTKMYLNSNEDMR